MVYLPHMLSRIGHLSTLLFLVIPFWGQPIPPYAFLSPHQNLRHSDISRQKGGVQLISSLSRENASDLIYGEKMLRSAEMMNLGLPVPEGFLISPEVGEEELESLVIQGIAELEKLTGRRLGEGDNSLKIAVRSSPKKSMPGLLLTRTKLSSREEILESIREVRDSWNAPNAVEFRKQNKIEPDGLAAGVQIMREGDRNENSAAGVVFTRSPITGKNVLAGRFAVKAKGEDIVKRATREIMPINDPWKKPRDLEGMFPASFEQLRGIKTILERKYEAAQEIEFIIEDGKLWLIQTKDAELTPQVQVTVMVEMANEGIIPQVKILSSIQQADEVLRARPMYQLKPSIEPTEQLATIGRGLPSSPGIAAGVVAFSLEKAREFHSQGKKGIILFAFERFEQIEEAILSRILDGLVTSYGHEALHESVLARSQAIPVVDQVQNITYHEGKMIYRHGRNYEVEVKEGEVVIINGSDGSIYRPYPSDERYGDPTSLVRRRYLDELQRVSVLKIPFDYTETEGKIRREEERNDSAALLQKHALLMRELRIARRVTYGIVMKNLRAHVIHQLLLERGIAENKTREQVEFEISQANLRIEGREWLEGLEEFLFIGDQEYYLFTDKKRRDGRQDLSEILFGKIGVEGHTDRHGSFQTGIENRYFLAFGWILCEDYEERYYYQQVLREHESGEPFLTRHSLSEVAEREQAPWDLEEFRGFLARYPDVDSRINFFMVTDWHHTGNLEHVFYGLDFPPQQLDRIIALLKKWRQERGKLVEQMI